MANAICTGATNTGTGPSKRQKKDMGGSKKPISGFSCPVVIRGKHKKTTKRVIGVGYMVGVCGGNRS